MAQVVEIRSREDEEALEASEDLARRSDLEGLTVRAMVLGVLVGTVTTLENIYFALKYGWTVTNNISAAILGFALLRAWSRVVPGAAPLSAQENCVMMTFAVSATAMIWGASMPFAILAMQAELRDAVGLEGDTQTWAPSTLRLGAYAGALCFIGLALAVPLRKKYVRDEPLPFPYVALRCPHDSS